MPKTSERAQSNRDDALALQDARMISVTGSGLDMLPIDQQEDMRHDIPQAPQTAANLSASARTQMNHALCIYGTDGRTPPISGVVEDAMIAHVDGTAYREYDFDE